MYTNRSIFLCTFYFSIDMSTKKIRSKARRKAEGVIAKGKDKEALKNDLFAVKRALRKVGIDYDNKKWKIEDIVIEKYLSESLVD